jgi:(1->4)-alpha-D-glucan 1-alpha-D-glucosylmutase
MAESPAVHRHVDAVVREANGVAGNPASFDKLHELLENQAYRLAAGERRPTKSIIAVSSTSTSLWAPHGGTECLRCCHALLKRLVAEGKVTGVRVDHQTVCSIPRPISSASAGDGGDAFLRGRGKSWGLGNR